MYTKNWKNFPLPLAFNLKTLYTHMESDIVTRRSVLVTEAKGNGLHVGAFLNNRFCNTRRFPVNETIQIIFKVFKYVLKLQLDTLESEGAVLGISTSRTLRSWEAKPEKALKAECQGRRS